MTIKINGDNTVANPGFSGDDTDTGLQVGTNELKLVTGGTAKATVDSSGRLLVGTSTASSAGNSQYSKIEVSGNTSNSAGSGQLSIKRGKAASLMSDNEVVGRVIFASETGGDFAYIQSSVDGTPSGSSTPGDLSFLTTSSGLTPTERMRLDSSGNLNFSQEAASSPYPEQKLKWSNDSTTTNGFYISQDTGRSARVWHEQGLDILFGTNNTERMRILSGGGLTFNGDSAQANALDDYEEGTWTPVIANLTLGNGTLTGHYTKIGNIVHLSFRLEGGSTTSFSGNMNGITGFPFTAALASNTGYLTASNASNNWFGFTTMYAASTGTNFIQWPIGSTPNYVGSNTIPFTWGSSTYMRFNITYRTT